jgi:hypothetical protein
MGLRSQAFGDAEINLWKRGKHEVESRKKISMIGTCAEC